MSSKLLLETLNCPDVVMVCVGKAWIREVSIKLEKQGLELYHSQFQRGAGNRASLAMGTDG